MEKNTISVGTIIRTVLLALALGNQILMMCGKSPIPIADETVTEFITTGFTIVTAVIAWWKNNSFTQYAIAADKVMHDLRANELSTDLDGE